MMEHEVIVRFENVTKVFYEGSPRACTAIRDVSFEVHNRPERGEFIAILGPSGCGKSTILRLIAGLRPHFPPTSGSVKVLGSPVTGPGPDRGFVFQDYSSFDNRTVLDNIAFGLECAGVPSSVRKQQAEEWVAKVGLDVARDAGKFPHQLSGGMRQRVAIARSWAGLLPRKPCGWPMRSGWRRVSRRLTRPYSTLISAAQQCFRRLEF
jgi:ABC-type nitrate/sulfonate/bicarbonate transport system ATPase subunit